MGSCRLVLVGAILVQLGYFTTNALRSKFLLISTAEDNGNQSIAAYEVYETAVYNAIIILQMIEYCVLLGSVSNRLLIKKACRYLTCPWLCRKATTDGQRQHLARAVDSELQERIKRSWKQYKIKRIVVASLLAVLSTLAFTLPALGFYRDFHYNFLNGGNTSKVLLAFIHEIFKFGNLFTNFLIRLFFSALYWSYASEWDAQIANIPQPEVNFAAGADMTHDITTQALANTYCYYSHYHRTGAQTRKARESLQRWFVMQYLVYLITIYTDVVHVVRPVFKGAESDLWDILHHSLYILYDFVTILFPYLLVVWMVDAHRYYYNEYD